MRTPYTLHFKEQLIIELTPENDNLPGWSQYPLIFTQQNRLYEADYFKVLLQTFNHRPFYIEIVEVFADKPFDFQFEIKEKQVFLFFMLNGDIEFYGHPNQLIAKTLENNFLMSFYDVGKYTAAVGKGKQIALVVTIDPEWLEKVGAEYRNILRILTEYRKAIRPYQAMYQGKIDRNIHRWLRKVYSSQKQDIGIFDGFLRMHMSMMLKHYDKLLDNFWIAFDIRDYILENLTDEELGIEMLCRKFNLSKRVLRYQFSHNFGENILTFINNKRMILADGLMRNDNLTITDVYMRVGYKDESTFRYHFNRYKP